jgi:SAM-dependent methyltransferase
MTPADKPAIAAAYSAAADHYDGPALAFWNYFGERTVQRMQLSPGAIVLDVCSGAGASAIPAARAVAPTGRVIGLDLAPPLIALARAKAPLNAEFRHADFEQAYFRPATFDAVVCVFGIFFFPDMAAALQRMWRLLRPGGQLAITVWGHDCFEPLGALFPGPSAWTRLASPGALESLFHDAAISPVEIVHEAYQQPIRSPEDWWSISMGSGYRATIDELSTEDRDRLRAQCFALSAPAIRLPVAYALARRC